MRSRYFLTAAHPSLGCCDCSITGQGVTVGEMSVIVTSVSRKTNSYYYFLPTVVNRKIVPVISVWDNLPLLLIWRFTYIYILHYHSDCFHLMLRWPTTSMYMHAILHRCWLQTDYRPNTLTSFSGSAVNTTRPIGITGIALDLWGVTLFRDVTMNRMKTPSQISYDSEISSGVVTATADSSSQRIVGSMSTWMRRQRRWTVATSVSSDNLFWEVMPDANLEDVPFP